MKKNKLPVATEHEEAVSLIEWRDIAAKTIDKRIGLLYSIPNGGVRPGKIITNKQGKKYRYSREAEKMKAEGLEPGIPDYFLPMPKTIIISDPEELNERYKKVNKFHTFVLDKSPYPEFLGVHIVPGLYLELKRSNGRPSDLSKDQRKWKELLEGQGYAYAIGYGWIDASEKILEYLGIKGR